MTQEFQDYVQSWKNEDDYNTALHRQLSLLVEADTVLNTHRAWVERHQHGFGDRPFHYMWKMLVEQVPRSFTFMEVGVFKGQVLSLVNLLAKRSGKDAVLFGVTTLSNTEDTRCRYPEGDYKKWIHEIHDAFSLSMANTYLYVGKSNDANVLKMAYEGMYDIMYIDGGHDYPDVCLDILNYAPLVKVGGFLVMDDASIGRLNIGQCWPGLEDVARAVATLLDKDPRFKFLMACGHLNVFQRIYE